MRGGTTGWQLRNARQSLRLSIDSSPYHSPYSNTSPASITPSSSTHASITTSGTTPSSCVSADWHTQPAQQVVCRYDFDSTDPDHLPFRVDEVLVVVKQEESGWWAAMRPNEDRVGWIPSAFVELVREQVGERLQCGREEKGVDGEAERLREAGHASGGSNHPMIHFPESHEEDWVPVVEDVKAPSMQLVTPTDLVPGRQSPETGLLSGKSFDSFFCDTDEEESPVDSKFAQVHPSPTMIIPRPSLPRSNSLPRGYQSSVYDPPSKHGRSRSDSTSTSGRHRRRRPMYVDDRASLSRLSTLLESEETNLLSSPDINQSFDAFARTAMHQAEKNRQRRRDETSINNSPKSPLPHGPWYLRPSYSDELKVDTDGQVKAGTLRALVEKLTIDPFRSHDLEFRKIFLLTFRSFVTAERLFDLLVERFEMRGPSHLSPQEVEEWKEKKLRPVQNRVLTVMTMWLEDYHLLDEEPEVAQKLANFLSAIVMPSHLVLTAKLILQSLERMTFARPISLSHQASSRRCRKPKSHKNDLLRWNPDELVEQLCLIEHKYYANIRPQECLNWAKLQAGEEVENITTFCHTHDQLAAWVKVSILNSDVLGKRADVIDFWIRVADKCRNVHNFHSMSAVIAGLSSAVIARLHLSWSHCSRKSQYDALVKLCDPLNGFSGYKCLQSTEGPCIPYVRTFLTDVIQIQGQYTDTIPLSASQGDVAFISFTKRQKWYDTVSTMLRYQSKPYQFVVDQSARSFIEGVLYSSGTAGQDWFWSKSQEIQQSELAHADIRKGLEAAGF